MTESIETDILYMYTVQHQQYVFPAHKAKLYRRTNLDLLIFIVQKIDTIKAEKIKKELEIKYTIVLQSGANKVISKSKCPHVIKQRLLYDRCLTKDIPQI